MLLDVAIKTAVMGKIYIAKVALTLVFLDFKHLIVFGFSFFLKILKKYTFP